MFIPYVYNIILCGQFTTISNGHNTSAFLWGIFQNFSRTVKNWYFWSSENYSRVSWKYSILYFLYIYTENFYNFPEKFQENSGNF